MSVPFGGTGLVRLTAHTVFATGNGTNTVTPSAVGSNGQLLIGKLVRTRCGPASPVTNDHRGWHGNHRQRGDVRQISDGWRCRSSATVPASRPIPPLS